MAVVAEKRVRRLDRGEAMVEAALAFPLLVLVALALVQLAVYAHAENVVVGATQDGARVAAGNDRTISDGIATTRALLRAGLGARAASVSVQGSDDGTKVTVTAAGTIPAILPLVGSWSLPVRARASFSKESFVVGPGG